MGRTVTIMGMGRSGLEQRHNMDRSCAGSEVWGLNNGFMNYPEAIKLGLFTRWYEVHTLDYLVDWDYLKRHDGGMLGYFRAINAIGVPVYTSDVLPCIVQQERFPELDMTMHFGSNFWDGTPSRMFAHAIYEHDMGYTVDKIQSFGIDMQDPQHEPQKPYWAYWIGKAQERGIKLGGTIAGFMREESDEGTRAIRRRVTRAVHEMDSIETTKGG